MLVTPFLVSCLHALAGILLHRKCIQELCRSAVLAPFVAARISYLKPHKKSRQHGWPLTLSDREPPCVWVHRSRLLFFSSFLQWHTVVVRVVPCGFQSVSLFESYPPGGNGSTGGGEVLCCSELYTSGEHGSTRGENYPGEWQKKHTPFPTL